MPKKAHDVSDLMGTWTPVAKGSAQFRFDADGTVTTWYADDRDSAMTWKITADPKGPANRLRLTDARPGGLQPYDCVFELDGDALKFLFVTTRGKEPPEKLEAGPDFQLHELTQQKNDK